MLKIVITILYLANNVSHFTFHFYFASSFDINNFRHHSLPKWILFKVLSKMSMYLFSERLVTLTVIGCWLF